MIIENITIREFKSIRELSVDLGKLNVLVGANGSGKSNILEAIGILSASIYGRVDNDSLKTRGVRLGVPRLYKSSFEKQRTSPHIYFEAKSQDSKYAVSLNNPLDSPRSEWHYKSENLTKDGNCFISRGPSSKAHSMLDHAQGLVPLEQLKYAKLTDLMTFISNIRNYSIYSPNTNVMRGVNTDEVIKDPVGLNGGNLAEAVSKLLIQSGESDKTKNYLREFDALLDWVSSYDVTFSAGSIMSSAVSRQKHVIRFTDRYMKAKDQRNQITAHDASEGALYVLLCAVLVLLHSSPNFFAMDNFDNCLNPRLLSKLVRIMTQAVLDIDQKQVLLTVHNPLVLDGLNLSDDRVRLFTVDRNAKGHTMINRVVLTEAMLDYMKETGVPLSRLWVTGQLGGVPNV